MFYSYFVNMNFLIVFSIGTTLGWFLEFIYKLSKNRTKIINPGFLSGPFVPIYGFGCVLLYIISTLKILTYYKVILFLISTTFVELITGVFFLNYYKLRLWDYRTLKFNYKGFISLRFSIYWTILSVVFYYAIFPLLNNIINILSNNVLYIFLLGIYYGFFIYDMLLSFDLAEKLKILIRNYSEKERKALNVHLKELSIDLRSINLTQFKNQVINSLYAVMKEKNSS